MLYSGHVSLILLPMYVTFLLKCLQYTACECIIVLIEWVLLWLCGPCSNMQPRQETRPLFFSTSLLQAKKKKEKEAQLHNVFHVLVSQYMLYSIRVVNLIWNLGIPCALVHAPPELTNRCQSQQTGDFFSSHYFQTTSCYKTEQFFNPVKSTWGIHSLFTSRKVWTSAYSWDWTLSSILTEKQQAEYKREEQGRKRRVFVQGVAAVLSEQREGTFSPNGERTHCCLH